MQYRPYSLVRQRDTDCPSVPTSHVTNLVFSFLFKKIYLRTSSDKLCNNNNHPVRLCCGHVGTRKEEEDGFYIRMQIVFWKTKLDYSFSDIMKAFTLLSILLLIQQCISEKSDFVNHRRRFSPSKHKHIYSSPNKTNVVVRRLVAGGVSRCIAQMTLYPIDALRTLAQTRDGRTLADVGISSLVRGCATTSTFALFMGGIQFAVYEGCSRSMGPLLASATSAISSCVVSVPQEVIKQRLVTGIYPSFREAVSTIYSTEGVRGFYSAWRPTMFRNVPFVMTTFVAMDFLKTRRLRIKEDRDELSIGENLVIGMSSALMAGFLTQPVDVIKTRMMTQAASNQLPYKSALECLTQIVKNEGPLTLYAGLKQRSIYMCSLWGITFAMNGQVSKVLKDNEVSNSRKN